eukprot:15329534-Ditylum_brightwellii.AAC.1
MANAFEKDYASLCDVTEDVNEMRDEKGKKGVSLWSIVNAINKMVHTQVTTEHVRDLMALLTIGAKKGSI